jgi:hypothetical protein
MIALMLQMVGADGVQAEYSVNVFDLIRQWFDNFDEQSGALQEIDPRQTHNWRDLLEKH